MFKLIPDPNYIPPLKLDMCRCSNCGWSGKVSDCGTEMESDGCVDDFWYSDEELQKEEIEKWNKLIQLET